MKIGILNIKYGPNLGDGAIAECIESQLKLAIPDVQIVAIDIGGREDFGAEGSIVGAKMSLTTRLGFLPKCVQSFIKTTFMPPMIKHKYAQQWHEKLHDCDAIIIGGGHLLMDVDLYFPYRIMLAVLQTKPGTPIFVHGVGVSKIWTKRGIKCFRDAFNHGKLISASVRDKQSLDNWNELFPGVKASLCRDPAILAAECYGPINREHQRTKKLIAVGVADKDSMRQHADKDMPVIYGEISSYLDLVEKLDSIGYEVMLFTNGADDDYLQKVSAALHANKPELAKRVKVAPKAIKPSELVKQIVSADLLIAHRLHANILAYAYGVPGIGLSWDRKLTSFFEANGRTKYLVCNEADVDRIPAMVEELLAAGNLDNSFLVNEAKAGSTTLTSSIKHTFGI